MSYELSDAGEFKQVLQALNSDVDADSIGAVHGFFQNLPNEYELDGSDLDYLSNRGLDGLENLATTTSHFIQLQENDMSQFTYFTKAYPGMPEDLEEVLTPVNQGFSVGQASSTRAEAGFAATHLVGAGLAEKNGVKKTYRMNGVMEDYRMVERVVQKLKEDYSGKP